MQLASAQAPLCPELTPLLDRADQHIVDGEFAEADELYDEVVKGLSCGPLRSSEELAHVWITGGALAFLKDDTNLAIECFAAASMLEPAYWIQSYGSVLRRLYDRAAVGSLGVGAIELDPGVSGRRSTAINGQLVTLPVRVPAGLHLLQVVEGREAIWHAQVNVPEDGRLQVSWTPPEGEGRKKPPRTPGESKPLPFLAAAVGAGALSGLAAGGALLQNGAMKRAETVGQVESAYGRQVGFAVTSYGLGAVAVSGLVLHVAL